MPPLAAVPDLERELDALYGLELEEFTKARNDLATRLRKAHQAEAAAQVRAMKKPSVVAWAANRLAREQPALVASLVEAAAHLREVQQRALADVDERTHVTDAAAREREALRSLVGSARDELGPRATPQLLDRLTQTLRAAALDPELAPSLLRGRIVEELRAVGFGPLEAVAPRRGTASREREAREQQRALRAEAKRLAAEADAAEREADAAQHEATRLRREAERLRTAALEAELAAGAEPDAS